MTKTLVGTPDPDEEFFTLMEREFPERIVASSAWVETNAEQLLKEPQYDVWPALPIDTREWRRIKGLIQTNATNPDHERAKDDLFEAIYGVVGVLVKMESHGLTEQLSWSTWMEKQDKMLKKEDAPVVEAAPKGGAFL